MGIFGNALSYELKEVCAMRKQIQLQNTGEKTLVAAFE
jgi:hypothetical protein